MSVHPTPHETSNDEIIIRYRNVCKRFGEKQVLQDVSCDIKRGKITVIVGPSGVGKSVFIKHLVGLLKPDSGQIFLEDQDITHLSQSKLYDVRKRFGMLFQDGALFDSMTVGENIGFPLSQHTRLSAAAIRERTATVLAQVGLPGVEPLFPSELSGGMRKRVAFARAIVLEPEIVLFDEPNSGLDPVMADAIDQFILQMQRSLKTTFIVISHDVASTWQIADDVGMLYQSRLVAFGPKEEIRRSKDPILHQFFNRQSEGPIKVV